VIALYTVGLSLAYLLIGFFVVPVITGLLRPFLRLVNLGVSGPAAKESELGPVVHMIAGQRVVTVAFVVGLLLLLAWVVVTYFIVWTPAIWTLAILLCFMNVLNGIRYPLV